MEKFNRLTGVAAPLPMDTVMSGPKGADAWSWSSLPASSLLRFFLDLSFLDLLLLLLSSCWSIG